MQARCYADQLPKTFTVLAQAIGIDVDVFTEVADAEEWLETENAAAPTGGKPSAR